MIELIFKVTRDGSEPRNFIVRIHGPTRNPPEKSWPWNAVLELDGRNFNAPGTDPLDAIEAACQLAESHFRIVHADSMIEPPIAPRESTKAKKKKRKGKHKAKKGKGGRR
jgi:hypothetical protein